MFAVDTRMDRDTVYIYSMNEPTRRQQQILDFILKQQRTEGATPTCQEIAEEFGFRSPNSVTQHLRLLRQKGCLESDSGKARSLRVISPLAKLRSRIVDIPLFGSIPAGPPKPANRTRRVALRLMWKASGSNRRGTRLHCA